MLGMFTVYPAFGVVLPGMTQTVTVDCLAEIAGKCEEVQQTFIHFLLLFFLSTEYTPQICSVLKIIFLFSMPVSSA